MAAMTGASAGTVTLVLTDIVASTERWDRDPTGMQSALTVHDAVITDAIQRSRGAVVKHTGDGLLSVFETASDAVAAAVQLQLNLATIDWGATDPLDVRVAVHTGEVEPRGDDYFGLAVHEVFRLNAVAYGGQVLVSHATRLVVGHRLPDGVELRSLGAVHLRGLTDATGVFQAVHPSLKADFPPIVAMPVLSGVPAAVTPLIDRERELDAVLDAADHHRLVTLVGMGGVGKTRLALAAADLLAVRLSEEVWWCELASVDDAEAVPHLVASVIGASEGGRPVVVAIAEAIGSRRALLVLDTVEHVLAAVVPLVRMLVPRCPLLQILCTGRERLSLSGEYAVTVPPLSVGGPSRDLNELSPAVRLFVDRARAADSTFELTAANVGAITEVCRRIDGLPLAVEIAAARVRSMSPAEILRLLDRRFRLLRWDQRDQAARHQSLQATIGWSYGLLSEGERGLFDRLSVFCGSFDLTAAHSVCGDDSGDDLDTLDALDGLVRRSMLTRVDGEETRYQLLESLRAYGRGRLDEDIHVSAVFSKLSTYYVHLAETANAGLQGSDDATWVGRLHIEFADLRGVHRWAVDSGNVDVAMRMPAALFEYAFHRLRLEVGEWGADALALPGANEHPLWGEVHAVVAYLAWARGETDVARRYLAVALQEAPTSWVAHDAAGTLELFLANLEAATDHYAEALHLAEAEGNGYRTAIAQSQMAFLRTLQDDPEGIAMATAAQHAAERTGNVAARSHAAWAMGMCLLRRDPPRALDELERCIELAQEVD